MSVLGLLDRLRRDTLFALRVLRKDIGFTTLVVLSLALGIGANSAIFTLINALVLRPLPVREPGTLVQITKGPASAGRNQFSFVAFERLREADHALTDVFAWHRTRMRIDRADESTPVDGLFVSGKYHDALGIRPAIGRMLRADDEKGSPKDGGLVAVIGYGYWQRAFGQDPNIVGKALTIQGAPFTIVGVEPPRFFGLEVGRSPDVTIPITAEPIVRGPTSMFKARGANWLRVFARVPAGTADDAVRARLKVVAPSLYADVVPASLSGKERDTWLAQSLDIDHVGTGLSDLRSEYARPLGILLGMVGLVLLIACANIASLLLARATARRREVAIRYALGGRRLDIVRQLLVEGLLASAIGGAFGLLLSIWGSRLLLNMIAPSLGDAVLDTGVDRRVLAFTAAIAMLSGLVFGLAPAVNIRGLDVGTTLKQQARNLTGNSGRRWGLRHLLVVCQVALSLLLLVGAGLFVQSFRNLQTLELGYAREHVLIASMALRQRGIQGTRLAPAYNQLLDRLNATPGVLRATAATFAPLEGGGFTLPVKFVETGDAVNEQIQVTAAGPSFFEVLGIKVKSGRGIGDGDTEQSPKVVVINEALARTYFPRESPIGRHLIVGDADGAPLEVVGVAEDVRYDGLRSRIAPTVFTAWRQDPARVRALTLIVRTTDATGAVAAALRRELRTVADLLAVTTVVSLEERLDRQLGRDRLLAVVSGSFAWLALLLAAVGLYGVMAYTVARRTAEIGLRMALGAQRGAIIWLVLRETLWLVLAGIAIGIPLALAATRTVSSLLFGLDSQNALSLSLATFVMLVVSLIAAYLPARGASRVDPTIALQAE